MYKVSITVGTLEGAEKLKEEIENISHHLYGKVEVEKKESEKN